MVHNWAEDWNCDESIKEPDIVIYVATQAARWGADQELEACCEWLEDVDCDDPQETAKELRTARRPNPTSLKQQALCALIDGIERGGHDQSDIDTIRRALEALPDD
jgi:hypothetical protein